MGTQEASFSFTEAQVRSVGDAPLIRVALDQRDLFASIVFGALTGVAKEGAYGNFAAYAAAYAAVLQCESEIAAPVAHGHWHRLIPGFIRCLSSERTAVAKLTARAVAGLYPHEGPERSVAFARRAFRLFKFVEFTAIAANVSAWRADRASPANVLELRALVRPLRNPQAPAGQPVLGIKEVYPGGKGWGTKAPAIVYNGGVPSGLIDHIRWRNWGAPVAYGSGITSIYKPNGGYYPQQVPAELRAEDLGRCRPGGPLTYRRLYVRNPLKPGGPVDQWRLWSLLKTLCRKAF